MMMTTAMMLMLIRSDDTRSDFGATMYMMAQKSKPIPNYQKIILNRIKNCE